MTPALIERGEDSLDLCRGAPDGIQPRPVSRVGLDITGSIAFRHVRESRSAGIEPGQHIGSAFWHFGRFGPFGSAVRCAGMRRRPRVRVVIGDARRALAIHRRCPLIGHPGEPSFIYRPTLGW
jgi:hypothetical protein